MTAFLTLASVGALLALAAPAQPRRSEAQASAADDTFRVDVKLVRVLATVEDHSGNAVGTLNKEDLRITDNGAPQQIALFERHPAQPLSIAILLDISGSTAREMKYQTDAVSRFVKELFSEGNPDDRASLFAFNWQVSQEVGWSRSAGAFMNRMR